MIFAVQCFTNASNAEDNTLWQVLFFYSAPQCSHCKRCTSYSNSVCPSHAGTVSAPSLK